jgi:hypothetical protein
LSLLPKMSLSAGSGSSPRVRQTEVSNPNLARLQKTGHRFFQMAVSVTKFYLARFAMAYIGFYRGHEFGTHGQELRPFGAEAHQPNNMFNLTAAYSSGFITVAGVRRGTLPVGAAAG